MSVKINKGSLLEPGAFHVRSENPLRRKESLSPRPVLTLTSNFTASSTFLHK